MRHDITLRRIVSDNDSTLGVLEAFGSVFATCEDEHREEKVPKETRIPAGTYQIKLRVGSPMATRYGNSFGPWHQGMLWLQDVPGFTYVYIHIGNDEDDTEGCPLIANKLNLPAMTIEESRLAYKRFYPMVKAQLDAGDEVWITITDED